MATTSPPLNGKARPAKTAGYRGHAYHVGGFRQWDRGRFNRRDIPAMLTDPKIQFVLSILDAPVHVARVEARCQNPAVKAYVERQFQRIWDGNLDKVLEGVHPLGSAGGEVTDRAVGGFLEIDELLDIRAPHDRVPLLAGGKITGINVYNVEGASGPVRLARPGEFWWVTHRGRHGNPWGQSALAGCWRPWVERTQQKGFSDCRRIWYFRHCFTGGVLRYPPGTTLVGGVNVPNDQYANELMAKVETGGFLVLPNETDQFGNYLWYFEPAAGNAEPAGLREYGQDLHQDYLEGAGIPIEVVQAQESGSGWAGRSVPFLVFLAGRDRVVGEVVRCLDQTAVRPRVLQNFGDVPYDVAPRSLVPAGGPEPEQPKGKAQASVPGNPPGTLPAAPGQRPVPEVRMSQDAPDAPEPPSTPAGEGKALAEWYAELLTGFTAAGEDVPAALLEMAREDLAPGEWVLANDGGTWAVHHASDAEPGGAVQLAQERAPKGGVTIHGKHYPGGRWVPANVVASATPAEKAALEGAARAKADERRGRGSVDAAALGAKLAAHAAPLDRKKLGNAKRAFAALHRHHGELALHRIEELHAELEKQLRDYAGSPTMQWFLRGKLASLHAMLGMAAAKGVTGQVVAPAKAAEKPAEKPLPADEMKIGGKKSVGRAVAKSDGAAIYAFRAFGKIGWSGDGENIRKTKAEAFADARKSADVAATTPEPKDELPGGEPPQLTATRPEDERAADKATAAPQAPAAPKPSAPAASKRKLPSVASISDFRPGVDKVIRKGNRTFVSGKDYADREVQSDVMTPDYVETAKKMTPDQLAKAIQMTAATHVLSDEGKRERLEVLTQLAAKPPTPQAAGGDTAAAVEKHLDALLSGEHAADEMVPLSKLRQRVGASKEDFDAAVNHLRQQGKVRPVEVSDARDVPADVMAGGIHNPDTGTTAGWLKRGAAAPEKPAAAAKPATQPTAPAHAVPDSLASAATAKADMGVKFSPGTMSFDAGEMRDEHGVTGAELDAAVKAGIFTRHGDEYRPTEQGAKALAAAAGREVTPQQQPQQHTPAHKTGDPKAPLASAIETGYERLTRFKDNEGGFVPLHALYADLKADRPGLTHQQFHEELMRLWGERKLELHVLNEVSKLTPEERKAGIEHNGKQLQYVYWRPGAAQLSTEPLTPPDRVGQLLDAFTEYLSRPSPPITVNVQTPPVTVQPADVTVHVEPAQVHLPAPQITVSAPDQPAPVVNVTVEQPRTKKTVERDHDGNIKSITEEPLP